MCTAHMPHFAHTFIRSGHLGRFQLLGLVRNAAVNTALPTSARAPASPFLGLIPNMELWGCIVSLHWISQGATVLASVAAAPPDLVASRTQAHWLHIFASTCYFWGF